MRQRQTGKAAHRHVDRDEWAGRGNITRVAMPEFCFHMDALSRFMRAAFKE
jgi:hypothetical protein